MLLPYLLKVSLLLAALTLGYRWLIQFETFSRLNRALLWFNVLAAWSLPLIPLGDWGPVAVQRQFHEVAPTQIKTVLAETRLIDSPTTPTIASSADLGSGTMTLFESFSAWGATEWLLLIYGLGVVVLLARFLYQLGRLALSLRKCPAERLENGLRLVSDPTTASPFSFFRWVVCDPARYSPAELQQILAHEAEHARGGHSFDLLLAEMQRIALWFNPFAWVHRRLVQGNLEYLADRAVLEVGFAKKQYQMNLLKAVVQIQEPPLTNSFAQSLLKNRIKMMNRQPSRAWVLSKYAALIAVLYLSTAFVAPYRQQLIELAPTAVQPVVRALVEENAPVDTPEEIVVPPVEKIVVPEKMAEIVPPVKADTAFVPKSKWIQMDGDTLFWVIPSTITWDELSEMRVDVKSFGYNMTVSTLKYDPLQKFLTAIQVGMYKPGGGGLSKGGEEDKYTPIKGYSGYLMKSARGIDRLPPEPLLSRYRESYQKALELKKENELEYIEDKLDGELYKRVGGTSTSIISREGMLKLNPGDTMGKGDWSGVGRSKNNTLMVLEQYKDAEFYVNGKPATFEDASDVGYDKLQMLKIGQDRKDKYYIMIYINTP